MAHEKRLSYYVLGISHIKAEELLEKYGENILPEAKRTTKFDHLIHQFTSPLIYILVIAGTITLLLASYVDAIVIFSAVFINTFLGFYQEMKAEKALLALKQMLSPKTEVIRNERKTVIDVRFIVPGDVVVLNPGDRVPADGITIETINLSVNESMLTGESMSVSKKKKDGLYMGTSIVSGRGMMLVSKTGLRTRMGKIAESISDIEDTKTPLQERIEGLAHTLSHIVIFLSIVILSVGLITGRSFSEMFTTSVALAVAAIPEGMAVSLTVILAIGMQRILKRKALVRRLVAAETLGSVTVIATDKTGTITEGKMRVSKMSLFDEKEAILTSVYANNLDGPLETALWDWSKSKGIDPQKISEQVTRGGEISFNSDRKYMSVKIKGISYVKGAPEVVLRMSQVPRNQQKNIEETIEKWSKQGLRIVALANGKGKKLKFLGLIGLEDPVRKDIKQVFNACEQAGIRVIMVTGDYAGTAESVWRKVGAHTVSRNIQVIDGVEINKMSDDELNKSVLTTDIFARVSPSQKLRIVNALQKNKEVVALVGDGVNDAPALKMANIGIVVGEATDVSKETADMVLIDSNFRTIVAAIEEGRGIFENMRRVISYLLSDGFTEIFLVIGSLVLGVPLPLTAAQILWINVITDGLPAVALTLEPKEKNLLQRKPHNTNLPLVDFELKSLIVIVSFITGIGSLLIFLYFYRLSGVEVARTVTFASLGLGTLVYVFSLRSLTNPIWKISPISNPFLIGAVGIGLILHVFAIYSGTLNKFLQTIRLNYFEWMVAFGFTIFIIILIEGLKTIFHYIRE